jgi:outer membrane protein assembly factor BamB
MTPFRPAPVDSPWLVALLIAAAALLVPSAAHAEDWPGFLGPRGDGVSKETGLLREWPAAGPKVLWKAETGEGFSAPAVAGGTVVSLHRKGDAEVAEAFDAATGKSLWRHEEPSGYRDGFGVGDGPRATPVIADGRVFTLGPAGVMNALDLKTGKPLWRRDLKAELAIPDNFFGVGSSPVAEGGLLLLNAGGADGAGIVALDQATGKTAWKATDDGASYSTPVVAEVRGKRLAFFLTRAGAVCLEPKTGAVRFSIPFRARPHASVNAATPVVAGDLVYFSASYGTGDLLLQVIDEAPGYREVRRGEALSSHFATPIVVDGHAYGFDGRCDGGDGKLRCIELKTGKALWDEPAVARGAMIRADGLFLIRAEDRLLLADLTPKGCRVISTLPGLRAPGYVAPALSDGRLFVRDGTTLTCLEVRAGK